MQREEGKHVIIDNLQYTLSELYTDRNTFYSEVDWIKMQENDV